MFIAALSCYTSVMTVKGMKMQKKKKKKVSYIVNVLSSPQGNIVLFSPGVFFFFVGFSVSDRHYQFMCDPKYFLSLSLAGKNTQFMCPVKDKDGLKTLQKS